MTMGKPSPQGGTPRVRLCQGTLAKLPWTSVPWTPVPWTSVPWSAEAKGIHHITSNVRLVIIVLLCKFGLFQNGSEDFHQTWHISRQGQPKKHDIGQSPEKVPRTSTESLKVPKTGVSNGLL